MIGLANTQSKKLLWSIVVGLTLILISACSDQNTVSIHQVNQQTGRWYSLQQVEMGNKVYDENCLQCHNARARGISKWKEPLQDGSYPPPPLNGSAHAWHHSLPVLLKTINDGGVPLGGKMPPFKDRLSDSEKLDVIAYFQSFWNDDIYRGWLERN